MLCFIVIVDEIARGNAISESYRCNILTCKHVKAYINSIDVANVIFSLFFLQVSTRRKGDRPLTDRRTRLVILPRCQVFIRRKSYLRWSILNLSTPDIPREKRERGFSPSERRSNRVLLIFGRKRDFLLTAIVLDDFLVVPLASALSRFACRRRFGSKVLVTRYGTRELSKRALSLLRRP